MIEIAPTKDMSNFTDKIIWKISIEDIENANP